jgi:hypothetical protein
MKRKQVAFVVACALLFSWALTVSHVSAERVSTGMAYMPGIPVMDQVRSPEMDKHSPLGYFVMYAPWMTQTVNCDGVVDVAGEWSDAAYYDISDTSGQSDGIKDPVGTVDLYIKQDSSGIWFGVINHADQTVDHYDQMGLYFDDDHDGCFPAQLTNEGNIWVVYDSSATTTFARWRCIQDTNCNASGYDCWGELLCTEIDITLPCYAMGLTNGQVSFEVMVPYGVLDHEIDVPSPVGMDIGFYMYVMDYEGIVFHSEWPSQGRVTTWLEPCYYGDVICQGPAGWYFKPGYPDYAPNGMPDFDQKRNGWDDPPGSGSGYYYCGPVAVGNCLWWFDSKFEPGNTPPPDSSDGYPLVTPWGLWDDHDPSNVRPFIDDLAARMRCNPSWGTYVDTMQMAIDSLLIELGLDDELEETTYYQPDFFFVEQEIERSQDVILLVGYWYEYAPGQWERWGGHYLTCAGVNSDSLQIAVSDPYYDNAESGGPGWVHDGSITPHPHGTHGPTIHDDAGNVSHDVYDVGLDSPSPGGTWWLIGYPPSKALDFFGLNVPQVYQKYQAKEPRPIPVKQIHTEVEYAVVICPKDTMYFKPGYEDYAPSGMPDFDQKQDQWDNPPGSGNWTYCGPVALGNCLWWFDSQYQWLIDPMSPQPPAVNDDFDLVTSYGTHDDHDRPNVKPFIEDLAWYMDTDGLRTDDGSVGTNVFEMEAAIAEWFLETETDTIFYKHTKKAPDFYWIESEIERCEDVILLLGFWQSFGPGEWMRVGGHYVTCAGVNSDELTLAISDPYYDNAETGGPGRILDGILTPHPHGVHGPGVHNDAGNVSHDYYTVLYDSLTPGGPWSIPDYPPEDSIYYVFEFANCPPEFYDLQTYYYGYPMHTEIEYAVAISPVPECWHYKGEYPDYAPDGMPDFDQNQHGWMGYCGPTAVANCLWWFDSKYQWLFDPGQPPPPYDYDSFDLVESYIPGFDDHSYEQDFGGWDNVQYLIEDLVGYMSTDSVSGTNIQDMQDGIEQWLQDRSLDTLFYEHTLIDSTRDPEFFDIIEWEIEKCQDVILLLGFWEEFPPGSGDWWRIGGHYVTCAGVCSDSLKIMISDPDYDQQEIDYPPDPKWHNNAALVSHDVYTVAPSPSPGGYWGLSDYPSMEVGPRHQLENCPDHLLPYEDYWHGLPLFTEIEAAVFVSPFVAPAAVESLRIYPDGGPTDVDDIRLKWLPVTTSYQGNPQSVDEYVIYRDTVPSFTPGPAKQLTTTTLTEYEDVGAAGDTTVNYYYIVTARKSVYESAPSACVGEFDVYLGNGGPKGVNRREGQQIKRR